MPPLNWRFAFRFAFDCVVEINAMHHLALSGRFSRDLFVEHAVHETRPHDESYNSDSEWMTVVVYAVVWPTPTVTLFVSTAAGSQGAISIMPLFNDRLVRREAHPSDRMALRSLRIGVTFEKEAQKASKYPAHFLRVCIAFWSHSMWQSVLFYWYMNEVLLN